MIRHQVRQFALRIDAAAPPQRDRAVDALRALAIAGVIGGHWLVTALVPGRGSGGTELHDASPLTAMPALAPLSWAFQTLAVFFLVGGYSAACGYRGGYHAWLRRRLTRLARPVAALAAVWVPVTTGLYLAGVPATTVRTLVTLVISPLWFLCVYAGLTALTPAAMWLARRFGASAAIFPAAVVAAADLVRFGLSGPWRVGWVNVAAGWFVPYLLGVAWALGSLRGRRVPALMLAGGAAATAAFITWAGYPASMVGVNGAAISNLNPPSLAAVTFGIAQCGLALLLRDRLARWMRRPLAWAVVALANLSAMTLFLWHQTAFITVSLAGLLAGGAPGLVTAPAGGAWVAERLAWLPAFAAALSGLWLVFHRAEHGTRTRRSRTAAGMTVAGTQRPAARADASLSQAAVAQFRGRDGWEPKMFPLRVGSRLPPLVWLVEALLRRRKIEMTAAAKPSPVPDTYRRVTPCLVVQGAAKALDFYAQVFGAAERMRSTSPRGTIAHAEIQIGDSVVIVEDEDPQRGTAAPSAGGLPGTPVFQFIYVEDVDAVVARAVELGATLKRPPETQFYGDRDSFIIDPFGHGWTIATHVEDVSPEELTRRMAALSGETGGSER